MRPNPYISLQQAAPLAFNPGQTWVSPLGFAVVASPQPVYQFQCLQVPQQQNQVHPQDASSVFAALQAQSNALSQQAVWVEANYNRALQSSIKTRKPSVVSVISLGTESTVPDQVWEAPPARPRKTKKTKKVTSKKSNYRGVFWNSNSKCWQTRIMVDGVSKHLGFFDEEREAGKAYDLAALKHRGSNTYLNFSDESRNEFEAATLPVLSSKRKRNVAERTTSLRGVCWHKVTKKWKAAISIKGKYTHIGYFDNEVTAKQAYDEMALILRKED